MDRSKISDSYGNKPVLDFKGTPVFAELYALRTYKEIGFDGVWVDSYRRIFRTDLPEKKEPKISPPDFIENLLKSINLNGKLGGTCDLIIWNSDEIKFVELKRKGRDKIRKSQIDFLERAINNGVSEENFEIFEWTEK